MLFQVTLIFLPTLLGKRTLEEEMIYVLFWTSGAHNTGDLIFTQEMPPLEH
jgi:hypothetical protein